MAKSKYSEALQDAHMTGNMEKVAEINALIESEKEQKYSAEFPKEAARKTKDQVVNFNTVLNNDNTPATKIYEFLNKNIGIDWWEDEIETLDRLLWLNFGHTLSDVNRDKVLALRHLCRNDAAFFDWYEFNQQALSLGGAIASFDYLKKPSPGMTINAIHTLNFVRPDRESNFSPDVLKYICINLINDGIYTPPPSIAGLIGKTMNSLTSKGSAKNWGKVGEKFTKAVREQVTDETAAGIQARRLVVAESAANKYYS